MNLKLFSLHMNLTKYDFKMEAISLKKNINNKFSKQNCQISKKNQFIIKNKCLEDQHKIKGVIFNPRI